MKLIKPFFEIWEQSAFNDSKAELLAGVYKQIERAGRVCYKSEDKITEDSAKPFVDRMIASKHYAMLEHGTVYLEKEYATKTECFDDEFSQFYIYNPYSRSNRITLDENKHARQLQCVTTNLRVLVENGRLDDLQYICSSTEHHAKRYTVHLVCNRQVSHEAVRHRVMSFAQESTRYCNYTKGRFGGEIQFIEPCWNREREDLNNWEDVPEEFTIMYAHLLEVENTYFDLIQRGWKPQQAATILPNALKTELVITGFADDWCHFFDLRALGKTGAPHPQMLELAKPLYDEFVNRKYISPRD